MSETQTQRSNLINISTVERIACGAGGAAMMGVGLFRAAPGLAMTAAGAGLINRGACGHSYLYKRLGISTAKQAQRVLSDEPLTLERTIVVDALVDEVLDLLTDQSAAREVFRRLDHVEGLDADDELRLFFRQGSFRFDFDLLTEHSTTGDVTKLNWLIIPDEQGHEGLVPSGTVLLRPIEDGEATEVTVKLSVAVDDPRRKTFALLLTPMAHLWIGARLRRMRNHFRRAGTPAEHRRSDKLIDDVAEDLAEPTPTSQVA